MLFCANLSTGAALRRGAETCRFQSLYISYISTGNVPARLARLTRLEAALRVNDRRGRAKVSPAPRPLDTSTQGEGVSPLNEYTVSPEVLRSLKAGLPPAAVPPSRRLSPGKNGPPGPGKTYYLGAVLPGVAQGAGRAFAVGPVERAAADPATAGRISPDLTRPQLVLADLQRPSPANVPVARPPAPACRRGMAAAAQERCVTAWPPSWGSATASPPPSTGSGLRTDGGRLSPFCLRTCSWPIPATWWQTTFGCAMAPGRTSWRPGSKWAHG